MRVLLRIVCRFKGHRWWSPCAFYGDEIPPEFIPSEDATPSEKAEKLASYARFRCRRCGKLYPANFL